MRATRAFASLIPLLLLYALLNRVRTRTASLAILAAAMPITIWSLASYKVYGRVHWMVLAGFESQGIGAGDLVKKIVYQCSSLALVIVPAALLALVLKRELRWSIRNGAVAGLGLALAVGLKRCAGGAS